MSLLEKHKEKNPDTYDSWLKTIINIYNLTEEHGKDFVIWNKMTTEVCKLNETVSAELEMFEASCVYRDNVHRCFDYEEIKK
jgi:hypothetical protein